MTIFGSSRDAMRFLRDLTIALSIPLLAVVFLIQPFQVEGRSMQPLLADGERILVDKLSPRLRGLGRGDVVVFRSPADSRRHLIKRVVGLPGETIEIRAGTIYADGRAIVEDYPTEPLLVTENFRPVRLGSSAYFVLGDHRRDSEDSRVWGSVESSRIVGRAIISYWPPSKVGSVR